MRPAAITAVAPSASSEYTAAPTSSVTAASGPWKADVVTARVAVSTTSSRPQATVETTSESRGGGPASGAGRDGVAVGTGSMDANCSHRACRRPLTPRPGCGSVGLMEQLTRIRVVPHFMRLHEWIALEAGLYQAEGLEPELLADVMHRVSSHGSDPYFERPQDRPFVGGAEVANSACEWGSVCNAGAGMGKFVPDLYGVARFAIFAGPGSRLTRLSDLAGVPVGVGLMAG